MNGCKPAVTAAKVVPGLISALTDNISDAVKTEKEQLQGIATKIEDVANKIKELTNGE